MNPIDLAQALIRRRSVTPADDGALSVLAETLEDLGFTCHDLTFEAPGTDPIRNLVAIRGQGGNGRHFCFAGHTDVVPPGDPAQWSCDPFAAEVSDGWLIGRGASDMKGAIAAFVAACAARPLDAGETISLLITGDEEGVAVNGTARVLPWMRERGLIPDLCVVGEPTSARVLGDMVKIGRRGSLNGTVTVTGAQGHVAYPHLADNPLPRLIRLGAALDGLILDPGNAWFQPSNLEITSIDVGNPAANVIPARGQLRFNIRFNATYRSADLVDLLRAALEATGCAHDLAIQVSGEAFLTPAGPLTDLVVDAIRGETGLTPDLSTTGGTSDARFIRDLCPVVEFGLVGETMHKVDEKARVADIEALARIYGRMMDALFA